MMTKRRDGPAEVVAQARPAVMEALSAWLLPPYSIGDGGSDYLDGEDDIVIYGPDEQRFGFALALDTRPRQRDEQTLYLTSDIFVTTGEGTAWFVLDSPAARAQLQGEIERVMQRDGMFATEENVAGIYIAKALRALALALPEWPWLQGRLRGKPSVEVSGTQLVVSAHAGTLRFSIALDTAALGRDTLAVSLDQFDHPAVRDWMWRSEARNWKSLERGLGPMIDRMENPD